MGHGESEGEHTKGVGKKVIVDLHVGGTSADRVHGQNDQRAEDDHGNLDKHDDEREDMVVYVKARDGRCRTVVKSKPGVTGDDMCLVVGPVNGLTTVKGWQTGRDG